MTSPQAQALYFLGKAVKIKPFIAWIIKKMLRFKQDIVPKNIRKVFLVSTIQVQGRTLATIQTREKLSKRHVIFFHGGGYVMDGLSVHWNLIRKIINLSGYKVTYVDYPIAPEHDYKSVFSMVLESYNLLLKLYDHDEFIFMGDSAGGGLALAFLQKLRDDQMHPRPVKTVLFSPWLDITMGNPDIKSVEEIDILLTLERLHVAAAAYSNGADLYQPLLSPIYG